MTTTDYLVVTHSADFDGKCSQHIIKKYLTSKYPDAGIVWLSVDYGMDISDVDLTPNTTLILADFSFPPERMAEIYNKVGRFIWIDHHISAINNSIDHRYDYYEGIRDTNYAACELCWKYFYGDTPMPTLVTKLGRYDVMDRSEPQIFEFQFGLQYLIDNCSTSKLRLDENSLWYLLLTDYPSPEKYSVLSMIVEYGQPLYMYDRARNRATAEKCAYVTEFEGLRVIAHNNRTAFTTFFDDVYDENKHDAMLKYGYDHTSKKWTCSLYSTKDEVDCSVVAKKYGGGGHPGAAGFTLTTAEMSKLLL